MIKILLAFSALNGALATILAAMASHQPTLAADPYLLTVFEKANAQHYIHTVLAFITGLMAFYTNQRIWLVASGLFSLGITLFSYTLYLFALTGAKIAGSLTPIGGVCFILGWLFVAFAVITFSSRDCENKNE